MLVPINCEKLYTVYWWSISREGKTVWLCIVVNLIVVLFSRQLCLFPWRFFQAIVLVSMAFFPEGIFSKVPLNYGSKIKQSRPPHRYLTAESIKILIPVTMVVDCGKPNCHPSKPYQKYNYANVQSSLLDICCSKNFLL